MKRLLSIFALFVALGVNGQVVGGYIPKNSTQTATMGGLRVNGAITATGTIKTGSSTIQGGTSSATLQMPASSGTLANLSDAVFCVQLNSGVSSPADGTTYYIGSSGYQWYTVSSSGTITLPYNCTLVSWNANFVDNGIVGSSESATLSVAGTTTVQLSTAITFSAGDGVNNFSGTGLSTNFSANDRLNCKIITPTWATNPTLIFTGITLWFVRRQ